MKKNNKKKNKENLVKSINKNVRTSTRKLSVILRGNCWKES